MSLISVWSIRWGGGTKPTPKVLYNPSRHRVASALFRLAPASPPWLYRTTLDNVFGSSTVPCSGICFASLAGYSRNGRNHRMFFPLLRYQVAHGCSCGFGFQTLVLGSQKTSVTWTGCGNFGKTHGPGVVTVHLASPCLSPKDLCQYCDYSMDQEQSLTKTDAG